MSDTTYPCDIYSWCCGHPIDGEWRQDFDVNTRMHTMTLASFTDGGGEMKAAEFIVLESVTIADGDRYIEDPTVAIGGEEMSIEDAAGIATALLGQLVQLREIAAEVADVDS